MFDCPIDCEIDDTRCQQGRERRLGNAEDDAGEAQVAKLDGETQAVGRPAPLADDGKVGFAQRVVPDQVVVGVGHRQQALSLGGGQDRTAGYVDSLFSET